MMSNHKAALKSINEAIKHQKFDEAIEKATDLLRKAPKNYQAHIFLAFALDKKNREGEAEETYNLATALQPRDAQALQGLVKLYERQGTAKLAEYRQAAERLALIFHAADDLYRSQSVVDDFIDFVREHGDRKHYGDALWILTPESPLYSILEGRFPHPAKTYERLAQITEDIEKKSINKLIGERRPRLGVKLEDVAIEAKREVYGSSRLEHIYRQVIDWTADDALRRSYEEKLLQLCYDRLLILPSDAKPAQKSIVNRLATDMVIIKHPFKLAWEIAIDWQDHKEIQSWDAALLRDYCLFFPDSDLYKIITAYISSKFPPIPALRSAENHLDVLPSEESEDDEDGGVPTSFVPATDEERMLMLTEGISNSESVFGYRLAGDFYLQSREYESTVEFMRKAIQRLENESRMTGQAFSNTHDAFYLLLATALVYYQTPRHHQEAKTLFEQVLQHDETSNSALIGIGLIFEEEEEYDLAVDFLGRALAKDESNLHVKSEAAWVKALTGDWQVAKDELLECCELLEQRETSVAGLLANVQYRLGCCVWNLDASRQARKRRKGDCAYAYWLAALSHDLNHASTYTSLGIFYGEYAKDRARARRCFQKALELSSGEVVAAEKLARLFADDGDWDRVELVAQRVVDSGKVKPPPGSKRKGISWPFAALGVAELNKQNFHQAVVSFQSALRLSPDDYHSWIGLGESYHNSGRYMAATKAILNAQNLAETGHEDVPVDDWFSYYMLGNIKHELGDFDESVTLYQKVLKTHPDEEGVMIALMQTMVDNATTSIEKGLFGKAASLAVDTIQYATTTSGGVRESFNFWKTLADSCSIFATVQSRCSQFPSELIEALLKEGDPKAFDLLANTDNVGVSNVFTNGQTGNYEQVNVSLDKCLQAAILCHKRAIFVSSTDLHAQAVAHYNLGWAELKASQSLSSQSSRVTDPYSRASVRAFKRAIELESGNAEFWNAMGVATSRINQSVSQHAFVRSLHINERSPMTWTNLGTLALLCGDVKLANEAFTRAQSADPDFAHAWLGQAFIALLLGESKEAQGLFAHAMEIADATSSATRRHYAASMFDHIITAPSHLPIASLIQPVFALEQLQSLQPNDLAFSHLLSLYLERTCEQARAEKVLKHLCDSLEAIYESTESLDSLARFTIAKSDLARAHLATGSHQKAVDCCEMSLELSTVENESELSNAQRKKVRLSANLTAGLGQYFMGHFDLAVKHFEAALGETDGNADAACLLAQVLWAQGSERSKEKARSILYDLIETQSDHISSVSMLGIIGLLDNDAASLEAVVEELQKMRTAAEVTLAEQWHIGEVLRTIASNVDAGSERTAMTQGQQDVMLHPYLPHGWSSLAEIFGDGHAAHMAVRVAAQSTPPKGNMEAQVLAVAYAGTGKASDAQRALLMAPWESKGWAALSLATESL